MDATPNVLSTEKPDSVWITGFILIGDQAFKSSLTFNLNGEHPVSVLDQRLAELSQMKNGKFVAIEPGLNPNERKEVVTHLLRRQHFDVRAQVWIPLIEFWGPMGKHRIVQKYLNSQGDIDTLERECRVKLADMELYEGEGSVERPKSVLAMKKMMQLPERVQVIVKTLTKLSPVLHPNGSPVIGANGEAVMESKNRHYVERIIGAGGGTFMVNEDVEEEETPASNGKSNGKPNNPPPAGAKGEDLSVWLQNWNENHAMISSERLLKIVGAHIFDEVPKLYSSKKSLQEALLNQLIASEIPVWASRVIVNAQTVNGKKQNVLDFDIGLHVNLREFTRAKFREANVIPQDEKDPTWTIVGVHEVPKGVSLTIVKSAGGHPTIGKVHFSG